MPQDYSNLLTGLRVQSQIPLDVKNWTASQTTLSNLGINNNLAFTYVKGMIIYCIQEGTRWEWKPATGSPGLLSQNFAYPNNIITFGINYSNQAYNFYQVVNFTQISSDWNATSGVTQILNKPTITAQVNSDWNSAIGLSQILNKPTFKTINGNPIIGLGNIAISTGIISVTGTAVNNVDPLNPVINVNGSETKINGGTNITVTGFGTIASPYIINSINSGLNNTYFDNGTNTTVTGFGTIEDPYIIDSVDTNTTYSAGTGISLVGTTFNNTSPDQVVVLTPGGSTTITGTYPNFTISSIDTNTTYSAGDGITLAGTVFSIDNLQKVITYPTDFVGTNYTLVNSDNNYEIIINNGNTPVTITVPLGLTSKIGIGFTQKGTGDVTYVQSSTTINNPIGLKIKGQYYQTYLSQEGNTNIYYLGGNTKI